MTTGPKQPCLCGCGGTPALPGSMFLTGHGARIRELLKKVEAGTYSGKVISEALLEVARADKNGSTCGFPHEDILKMCGKVI